MQQSLSNQNDQKYYWAFARDTEPPARRYKPSVQPRRNLDRYHITSCSHQAKAFGVKTGMTYAEAKKLVPSMRVIIYNR